MLRISRGAYHSTDPRMTAEAKDRMGHLIHQPYTSKRTQRYEQMYGWRPLKFRIRVTDEGDE